MSDLFGFLAADFGVVHAEAVKAAAMAMPDARTSCFYSRRALELAVHWAFDNDRSLARPYDDNLSALVNSPAFKKVAGEQVYNLAREIIRLGNQAVHSNRPIRQVDSVNAVSKLFHVTYWFARTYGRTAKPPAGLRFDPNMLPRTSPVPRQTLEQLQSLESVLAARDAELAAQRAAYVELDAEVQRLREEIAAAKAAAAAQPDTHDYSETETRDHLIDMLLREAGWQLSDPRDREFKVTGMPGGSGVGFVDYVLWGVDGKPLALVEAKRTKRSHLEGQHQAKLYADCLEAQFGQRPVIFCSNGYEHQIWDDLMYPPRAVQGFLTADELQLIVQRRSTRQSLDSADINPAIVERYYQRRSIRRIGEAFERDRDRKALVVMATGAGKTRTVIALCDVLMRCNWVKRVLFLADRRELVKQAANAFKTHLPDTTTVNLLQEPDPGSARVVVSTYQTMMGLIDELDEQQRRFGVGYFDLVVIDEAHRSVFQKYRAIFDYFDSLLVGLTATPRDEIDRNTYSLFDLETGVPTDVYSLEDAVGDGFLVPPLAVSVPLKFQREGIRYDDLSEEDKARWDELDWDDSGGPPPDEVSAAAVNKWLFNTDTVDKVLEHLMTRGLTVAGGDRLGKTIIFAANQDHADFIVQRFDVNYPHLRGEFARVITHRVERSDDLIDKFKIADGPPHIAVSVDMLDTGIDVPEVVNLVFFKLVRSKTKFWQMLGRGTRLCEDLFGPGIDKRNFLVFDFCQNLEFFSQNPQGTEGASTPPLHARLFRTRLALLGELDAAGRHIDHRASIADLLRAEVSSMHLDNFIVRPKRRLVERFATPEAWTALNPDDVATLANEVAGLPNQLPAEPEESKRFDLLMLNAQLALLQHEPGFAQFRDRVMTIASLLEERRGVPDVARELELIQAVQTDEWWQDVTLAMLEQVRVRLRGLVTSIERRKRKIVYTDFDDEIGAGHAIDIVGLDNGPGYARFLRKVRVYVIERKDTLSLRKVYNNFPLTDTDLDDLRRLIHEAGAGTTEDEERAAREAGGFGMFIRSLVGLDRNAAKQAFAGFLEGKQFNATQIEFINLVIDHLVANGVVPAARFYESPFTDLSPTGPDGLFTSDEVDQMIDVLETVRSNAGAA